MNRQGMSIVVTALLALLAGAGCVSTGGGSQIGGKEAAQANLQLGVAYLRQNNLPIAKEKLERARDQDSRSSAVHSALALLYEKLGDNSRADAEHRTALNLAPKDPEIQNNYAAYLCGKGRYGEGVERFDEAAANPLYRTPWAAYTNAGVCLRRAGSEGDAAQRFNKALAARPSYVEAIVQLADLELAQNKALAAYQHVEQFMMRNPPSAELLLLGWRAASALSDRPNIERLARRLQTEFPNTEQARAVAGARGSSG
jgi:type IV pilus assembly protein PilF